jgi:hypothetical protein
MFLLCLSALKVYRRIPRFTRVTYSVNNELQKLGLQLHQISKEIELPVILVGKRDYRINLKRRGTVKSR